MKPIKAVLFDLDGTLADTALDLGGALNALLRKKGLPEKELAHIRPFASHGTGALLKFGANITPEHADFTQWRQAYLAEYERCFDCDTVLFDGVNEVIAYLHQHGVLWGIITNKPQAFTQRLVPKLGFVVPPAVVVSGDTCAEAKPSVLPMNFACQQLGVLAEDCVYVGDAERDIQAGRNAGMRTVLALWGYLAPEDQPQQWGADHHAKRPLDLLDLFSFDVHH